MLELEALDSAGSLISVALACGHLPHTCLKVMKNHLREHTLRSSCHLLPAYTAHPDNEEKAGNTTQPHRAVCSYVSAGFTNDLLSVLKVGDILFSPRHCRFFVLLSPCVALPLSLIYCFCLLRLNLGIFMSNRIMKGHRNLVALEEKSKSENAESQYKNYLAIWTVVVMMSCCDRHHYL